MSTALNAMTIGTDGKFDHKWSPTLDTDRAPQIITVYEGGANTPSLEKDPVFRFGYNADVGGTEYIPNEGYGAFNIEGHFYSGGSNPAVSLTLSSAAVGTGVTCTASGAVFAGTSADVGKTICWQSGIAVITAHSSTTVCTITIIRVFPSTSVTSGEWRYDSIPVIEMYLEAGSEWLSGSSRPLFTWMRKDTGQIQSTSLMAGRGKKVTIGHGDPGDSDLVNFEFEQNKLSVLAPRAIAAADHMYFQMNAASTKSIYVNLSAHNDGFVSPSFKLNIAPVGGSSQHRTTAITMRSNGSGTHKTGGVYLRADDTAGWDALMVNIGEGASSQAALFRVTGANMPVTMTTAQLVAKTGQTSRVLSFSGLNNDGTTAEDHKIGIYPKGYITVRESGNTTTDRSPSTGTSTATFTATNKPGASTAVTPTMWFPMLSTAGALFWVPGWAD